MKLYTYWPTALLHTRIRKRKSNSSWRKRESKSFFERGSRRRETVVPMIRYIGFSGGTDVESKSSNSFPPVSHSRSVSQSRQSRADRVRRTLVCWFACKEAGEQRDINGWKKDLVSTSTNWKSCNYSRIFYNRYIRTRNIVILRMRNAQTLRKLGQDLALTITRSIATNRRVKREKRKRVFSKWVSSVSETIENGRHSLIFTDKLRLFISKSFLLLQSPGIIVAISDAHTGVVASWETRQRIQGS